MASIEFINSHTAAQLMRKSLCGQSSENKLNVQSYETLFESRPGSDVTEQNKMVLVLLSCSTTHHPSAFTQATKQINAF